MRRSRISRSFVLLTSLFCLMFPARPRAQRAEPPPHAAGAFELRAAASAPRPPAAGAHARSGSPALSPGEDGGIKEVIPDKYKERYLEWKNEFLSTEVGRREWELYKHNGRFTLTITISSDDRHGAGTSKYKWDDAGELVAATVTLGSRINEGYPNPIYHPVMNALLPLTESYVISDNVLAAAKIAHEFGHVKQAASVDAALYRLQNQLMPVYNQILLSNGRNVRDPRLLDLARRMGGTPVEIWESREYWGEVNAMLFLRERITDQGEQRALCARVRRAVELYAKDYVERFDQVTQ